MTYTTVQYYETLAVRPYYVLRFSLHCSVEMRIKADKIRFVDQFCKEGEELENYTKYALKSVDELKELLSGKDNLFVVGCNKCFKEFGEYFGQCKFI